MKKFGKFAMIVLALVVLAALTVYIAPILSRAVSSRVTQSAAPALSTDQAVSAKTFESFIAGMKTADKYSFSGTKSVSGATAPYTIAFTCSVSGKNYSVQTVQNAHTLRQLYTNGQYSLVDDTAHTVRKNISDIDFPDTRFLEALTGKLIRSDVEILNGSQVDCFEVYKNAAVYAFYFSRQGTLIRYYYIYDGSEITIDFSSFAIGAVPASAFDVPPSYTQS